jgi:PAS domain S-box-containing protein
MLESVERRQALLARSFLLGGVVAVVLLLPTLITTGGPGIVRALLLLGGLLGLLFFLGGLYLLKRDRFTAAVVVGATGMVIALTLVLVALGSAYSQSLMFGFALVLTIVSTLPSRRPLILLTALSCAILAGVTVLERAWPAAVGLLPARDVKVLNLVVPLLVMVPLLALVLGQSARVLRNALDDLSASNQRLQIELEERTRAERALRESEERYRLIAEHTDDLISIADAQNRLQYASPSHARVLGLPPDELIGRNILDRVHPDDLQLVIERVQQAVSSGRAEVACRYQHADGGWRWLEVSGVIVPQDGDTYYSVMVGRDVTERKRLEADLLQAQKMESIGRLAGGVAHDFNNLLVVIAGSAELALDTLPPDSPAQPDLRAIVHAADRAADLTRRLLAFARRQVQQPQTLNLNAVLGVSERLLRRLIGEDIMMIIQPAEQLWSIRADPSQIEQVVTNLVINARDAMPGGGRLVLSTANAIVGAPTAGAQLSLAPGAYVRLSVADTGTGMSDEVVRHAFEPFFTTKAIGRGTGLGLATCYGIVRQSGGDILIESVPGNGTAVHIYLPGVAATAGETAPAPLLEQRLRGQETILLAEDEPTVRALVARMLRAQGYTVIEAAGGAEALARLIDAAGTIDMLLTDVVMPGMRGWELAELATGRAPGLRVLFMSGYADSEVARERLLDATVAFLQKPFSQLELARKTREVLDNQRLPGLTHPASLDL